MSTIQVKDKFFIRSIPEEKILEGIQKIADRMNQELKEKYPLFVCVLNGAFMFASDLLKQLEFPCEITFIRLKSYQGVNSNGSIREIHGMIEDIKDRNVVIIEDIIDTGHTINYLTQQMIAKEPKSLKVATLLFKSEALQVNVNPDYIALEIPNDFIVGYGLDYDGCGRNLRDIYSIKN